MCSRRVGATRLKTAHAHCSRLGTRVFDVAMWFLGGSSVCALTSAGERSTAWSTCAPVSQGASCPTPTRLGPCCPPLARLPSAASTCACVDERAAAAAAVPGTRDAALLRSAAASTLN